MDMQYPTDKNKIIKYAIFLLALTALGATGFFAAQRYGFRSLASLPAFADSYQATSSSLDCPAGADEQIKFDFAASGNLPSVLPEFSINENPEAAITTIKFKNVDSLSGQFSYDQVLKCPLIGRIDSAISNNDLVVTISRQGVYLPASVKINGAAAVITLSAGNGQFPKIMNQLPAPDSAAFPSLRTISFHVATFNPLAQLKIYVNGNEQNFTSATSGPNDNLVQFPYLIEKDKEYSIKAIASDEQQRTAVASWTFEGQIPSQAILGQDRFKFLGWWGRITADGISVRKDPDNNSDKLGTLSSINNVKILKEVYGQVLPSADGQYSNGLWYQIDGGKYPGGYVFSEYVSPIAQPQPPANPQRPAQVSSGDNWIDVDLAKRTLTLFTFDNKPLLATYVSPGKEGNSTQTGTFNVWYKLSKAEMRGGPPLHSYVYDLKNIPWVMYYNADYAIHGAYWHDRFGTDQSAGCTNMTQGDAKFVFDGTKPLIPEGKGSVFSGVSNPGTVVYNHN